MIWLIGSVIITSLIGVDVAKNPQSYRNIGLRFGDGCRHLWFWPGRLAGAREYHGRHRRHDPLPSFMHSWHPPRPWSSLQSGNL